MSEQHEQSYNVALWLRWPSDLRASAFSLFNEFDEMVQAPSSRQAVLWLMETHKLTWVGKAAVRSPDGTIERWVQVDIESLRRGEVIEETRFVWRDGRWVLPHEERTGIKSEVLS